MIAKRVPQPKMSRSLQNLRDAVEQAQIELARFENSLSYRQLRLQETDIESLARRERNISEREVAFQQRASKREIESLHEARPAKKPKRVDVPQPRRSGRPLAAVGSPLTDAHATSRERLDAFLRDVRRTKRNSGRTKDGRFATSTVYSCPTCDKRCSTGAALASHIRCTHAQPKVAGGGDKSIKTPGVKAVNNVDLGAVDGPSVDDVETDKRTHIFRSPKPILQSPVKFRFLRRLSTQRFSPSRAEPVIREELLNLFIRMIMTREELRLRKASGAQWPWSSDEILNAYKFCNVSRRHDRTTKWLHNRWIDQHALGSEPGVVIFNIALFRAFGTVRMAETLGWQKQFDSDVIIPAALACDQNAFTDSYFAVRHSKERKSEEAAHELYAEICQSHLRNFREESESFILLCCFLIISIFIVVSVIAVKIQMSPNVPNVSARLQMSPDVSTCLQMSLDVFKCLQMSLQMSPDVSNCLQFSTNVCKCLQIFANVSRCLQMSQTWWNRQLTK